MVEDEAVRTAREAFMRQRVQLHLVSRLGARAFQIVAPSGVAHRPALVLAAVAWAAVDLALAVLLRRTSRGLLVPRVVLDAIDGAFWTFWVPGNVPYTQFALASSISIAESGFRHGLPAGVLAACVVNAGVTLGRWTAGHDVTLVDSTVFTVWAAVAGWVVARYVRARASDAARDAEAQAQARLEAVALEVRSIVQIGHGGGVIDAVQRGWWFLSLDTDPAAAARRARAQRYKAAVASQVRDQAAYLRDLLDQYAASVREAQVDTRRHIRFQVPVADGLTVLTADQATAVLRALAGADLAADTAVQVTGRDLSDGSFTLRLNRATVTVPPARGRRRLFLAPAAFLIAATQVLVQADPVYTDAPWWLCVAAAAALVTVAWGVQRLLAQTGSAYLGPIGLLAVLPVVLNALLGLAGRLTPLADGRVLIPVLGGLSGWAFVSGTIQPFAPRRWTAVSTLAAVGVVAVATLTYAPGLPSVGAFAGDLIFPLVAFVGSWQLSVGTVSADELVQQSLLAHLRERSTARVDQVLEAEVSVLRRELIDLDDAVRGAAPGQWRDAAGNSLREAQDQFTELTRTGLDRVRHTVTSRNAGAGSSPTLG